METVRILSIDGGGIRGIIPAAVLTHLERAAGGVPVHRMFDLIAGTSTGAILAAALTKPSPLPASETYSLYMARGPEIFRRSASSYIRPLISGPKYDAGPIERTMSWAYGDITLADSITPLLIPCYDIERREAHFFKSWRAATTPSVNYLTRDAVRCATAAPTYFAPALVSSMAGDRLAAIDAALFANNPTMCAMAEARVLFPNAKRFIVVSLGVGEFREPIAYENARSWGLIAWAPPVIDCAMDGSADTTHYQLANTFGANVEYHRFQIDLHSADPAKRSSDPSDCIDDASPANIGKLIARAQTLISRNAAAIGRLAVTLPSYAGTNAMEIA